jgi:hypothetical protein
MGEDKGVSDSKAVEVKAVRCGLMRSHGLAYLTLRRGGAEIGAERSPRLTGARSMHSAEVNLRLDLVLDNYSVRSESVTPAAQRGGNLERVVDAGRIIGTDRATGASTSFYTVITRPNGNLVTASPGRP